MTERAKDIDQIAGVETRNFLGPFAANFKYNPNGSLYFVDSTDRNRSSELESGTLT